MVRKASALATAPRLTAKDHTAIVATVMEHPQALVNALGMRELEKGTRQFTNEKVLEAVLAVPQLAVAMRPKVEEALMIARAIDKAGFRVPAKTRKVLDEVYARTRAAPTIRQKMAVLRRMLADSKIAEREDLALALRFAVEVLEDGAVTIYSARHPFYRQITSPNPEAQGGAGSSWDDPPPGGSGGKDEHPVGVGQADAEGVSEGAVAGYLMGESVPGFGAVTGEIGAGLGAITGGIGKSTLTIGKKFADWLFS